MQVRVTCRPHTPRDLHHACITPAGHVARLMQERGGRRWRARGVCGRVAGGGGVWVRGGRRWRVGVWRTEVACGCVAGGGGVHVACVGVWRRRWRVGVWRAE
eukprot:1199792-Prymnesium_polylepis.1